MGLLTVFSRQQELDMTNVFSKEQVRQIFESGAVGIDLGTTYSAVAAINNAGQVEILTNAEGALITPSVVLFDEDGTTVVGEQAKRIGQGQSHRVVECAKRLMGQKNMEYEIAGKRYSPEGISAILLGKLIKDASERLGRQVRSAVITVPAWFNDDARQATLRAGKASGLNVLGILSEPTAAALAYGVKGTKARYALVYDLGGGTFDVSVIEIFEDGRIEELARDGDVLLGGKDWDDRIVQRVREQYAMEFGGEFPVDCDEHMSLVIDAENAKKVWYSRRHVCHNVSKTTEGATAKKLFTFHGLAAPVTVVTDVTVTCGNSDCGSSFGPAVAVVTKFGTICRPASSMIVAGSTTELNTGASLSAVTTILNVCTTLFRLDVSLIAIDRLAVPLASGLTV